MNNQLFITIAIAVAILIAIGLVARLITLLVRSWRLKRKFGPEYNYALEKIGDRHTVEENLKEREKRVIKLDIRTLDEHQRYRYHQEWTEIQTEFVDNPGQTIDNANRLITEVMIARGFPIADFEQRAADLSVLYPNLVNSYRKSNAIAIKNKAGEASTEELRQAMVNYHTLFDQLLGTVHSPRAEKEPDREKQMEAA